MLKLRKTKKECGFYCKGNHLPDEFVFIPDQYFGVYYKPPYCKKCREITPDGNTIITYGYLYFK